MVLGEHLPKGFAFRATWIGSDVRTTQQVTVDELAGIARQSQLNEFTRYVVTPPPP